MSSVLKTVSFSAVALLAAFFLSGCHTPGTEQEQSELAELYYQGKLKQAASLADSVSDRKKNDTMQHTLLWHLEAGNADLAAGRTDDAMRALERAERLLYRFDSQGKLQLNKPGNYTYTGERSDRLLLHLLKGFLYLEKGSMEDFLVELRRMRVSQFRYLLNESDPQMRDYEKKHRGQGVLPYRMTLALQDALALQAINDAGLEPGMMEYSARRRPELSLLFNPIGFYLSAVGYYFNNEWDEARIDIQYLARIAPGNLLYRRDRSTLEKMLGDVPSTEDEAWKHDLGDQVVYIIYAQGRPFGWQSRKETLHLAGQVPTEWSFSYPDYRPFKGGTLSAESGGESGTAAELADLGEIVREEFYQHDLGNMLKQVATDTRAMTAANTAAKAALVAALVSNSQYKVLAIAAASAAVAATSKAYVNQREWRRWSTIPRHYSILHLPLGPVGNRAVTIRIRDHAGKLVETRTFVPDADTNRAVIFVRELDGCRYFKFWKSRE